MRSLAPALLLLTLGFASATTAVAQAPKTAPIPTPAKPSEKAKEKEEPKSMGPGGYRTLVGTIGEISGGGKSITLVLPEAGTKGARAAQNWNLSLGKQTLMLRANKNGQYSTIEADALAKGETVQVVAELDTDAEKAHRAWWLISLPAGTTPLTR